MAFLVLGGGLKRRELISARLGDIVSYLYLLSAALKRFEDEGRPAEDEALVDWCMADGIRRLEIAIDQIIANFPNRIAACFLRLIVPRDAGRSLGPSDLQVRRCAELVTAPSAARDRLTPDIYPGEAQDPIAVLERALHLVHEAEPVVQRLRRNNIRDWRAAPDNMLTAGEASQLRELDDAIHAAIRVDDFAPEELARSSRAKEDGPSQ
jgi:acyl-CoA dehydrogenase